MPHHAAQAVRRSRLVHEGRQASPIPNSGQVLKGKNDCPNNHRYGDEHGRKHKDYVYLALHCNDSSEIPYATKHIIANSAHINVCRNTYKSPLTLEFERERAANKSVILIKLVLYITLIIND